MNGKYRGIPELSAIDFISLLNVLGIDIDNN